MTLLALAVASWTVLSVVTALAFGAVAGAVKRSGPALDLADRPVATPRVTRASSPAASVALPAQRRATAPVPS